MANKEYIRLLTKYQMRVLYYKCKEGLTHAEIAEKLDRQVNTVQYHMTNIYTILEIKGPGKSKDEMDAELKNEICPIIREMFGSYDEINIWAPQPQYKPPPSLEKIINITDSQSTPLEIREPPPPGIRRINWWLIIGGSLIGLLVIALLVNQYSNTGGLDPTGTPNRPTPSRTIPLISQAEIPTRTSTPTIVSTSTRAPTQAPTHTPSPTPTPTPIVVITEISDIDGMVLVKIPVGEFKMGSTKSSDPEALEEEIPRHIVYLDTYWIDQTEVTNQQFAMCVEAGNCSSPANNYSSTRSSYYGNPQYADYPVIFVSWNQAADYCAWAERRLPTEAEWEKAARGPIGRIYPWGDTFDGTLANYCDINCQTNWRDTRFNDGAVDTSLVKDYPGGMSIYGILNMAGNVYEWVADWYQPYSRDSQTNPTGPSSGIDKIIRGGSWGDDPAHIRTAIRSPINPDNWLDFIGFRCAR